jgi:hypothetical protein
VNFEIVFRFNSERYYRPIESKEIGMSDWSKHAADRIRQKQQNDSIRDARSLQKERLLNEHAPGRWGGSAQYPDANVH